MTTTIDRSLPRVRPSGGQVGNRNKSGKLSPRIARLATAIATGQGSTAAELAEVTGLPIRTVYDAMRRPAVQEAVRQQIQRDLRTLGVARAAAVYVNLLTTAKSEFVRADIAKDVLAQAGVRDRPDRPGQGQAGGSITIVIGSLPPTTGGQVPTPSAPAVQIEGEVVEVPGAPPAPTTWAR